MEAFHVLNMEKNNVERAKKLFEKFRRGNITKEELLLLKRWWHHYRSAEPIALNDLEIDRMDKEIRDGLQKDRRKRIRPFSWTMGVAACLSLLLLGGVSYWLMRSTAEVGGIETAKSAYGDDREPGTNTAVLVLENGKEIVLEDGREGELLVDARHHIAQEADGVVVYRHAEELSPFEYNTLKTPRGGQYRLVLPDGSTAWLNASSSIRYPLHFSGPREVSVSGEVFFEVKHNPAQPFRVHTSRQVIEVLGTTFNVKTYPDEEVTSTSLVSGSVRVHSTDDEREKALLRPDFQAITIANSGHIQVKPVNIAKATAWKQGDFYFDGENIEEIMTLLSRWYDVDVVYGKTPDRTRAFGGVISRKKNLSAVLSMLESFNNVKFEIKGKEVNVMN